MFIPLDLVSCEMLFELACGGREVGTKIPGRR